MPTKKRTPFTPVYARQKSFDVAEQFIAAIKRGDYKTGDRLPSEHDLAHAMNVSRSTIREALAALRLAGLVESDGGRGSRITATAQTGLAPWQVWLRTEHSSAFDALQLRSVFEPALAPILVAGSTQSDLEAISSALARMQSCADARDTDGLLRADREFHLALVSCGRNELATQIIKHLFDTLQGGAWPKIKKRIYEYKDPGKSIAIHRTIPPALIARDASRLTAALHQHFDAIDQALRVLSVSGAHLPDAKTIENDR